MDKTHAGDLIPRHVRIECPGCLRNLRARAEHLGRKFRCRKCGHSFRARSENDEAPIVAISEIARRPTTFVEIPCPSCQRGLRVRTGLLGRRAGCKYCAHQFIAAPEQPAGLISPTEDRRPSTGRPKVEEVKAKTAERRVSETHHEDPRDDRRRTSQGSSRPAAPVHPAPRRRRAPRRFLFAQVAAACLLGGGALYFKGSSLADYRRRIPALSTASLAPSPGGRGMFSSHSARQAPSTSPPPRPDDRGTIVCSGRVEPVRGEIDVSSQIEGQLAEVRVSEGDVVREGDILAVLEGPREVAELSVAEASLAIARSRLEKTRAGNGSEEIQQALHDVEAQDALLTFEKNNLARMYRLLQRRALSPDDYDRQYRKVEQQQRTRDGLRKHYEAVRRGPLPQEIEVARAELALAEKRVRRAQVENDLRLVRAPLAGTILEVYRHAGDSVITDQPTPIVRMADTSRLRIRLEIDEASVARLRPGLQGTLQIRGSSADVGRLTVATIIPVFGPKRLFNPDTSARFDTRTIAVFCEPWDLRLPLYPGQRVTASLTEAPRMASTTRDPGRETPSLARARTDESGPHLDVAVPAGTEARPIGE